MASNTSMQAGPALAGVNGSKDLRVLSAMGGEMYREFISCLGNLQNATSNFAAAYYTLEMKGAGDHAYLLEVSRLRLELQLLVTTISEYARIQTRRVVDATSDPLHAHVMGEFGENISERISSFNTLLKNQKLPRLERLRLIATLTDVTVRIEHLASITCRLLSHILTTWVRGLDDCWNQLSGASSPDDSTRVESDLESSCHQRDGHQEGTSNSDEREDDAMNPGTSKHMVGGEYAAR